MHLGQPGIPEHYGWQPPARRHLPAFRLQRTVRPLGPDTPGTDRAPAAGSDAAARLTLGETLARGKEYGRRFGVELSDRPLGEFRSAAVSAMGNAFIAGVRDERAIVAKLDASGKRLCERTLPDRQFKEHAGGVLAPTANDGCVAYFLSYVHPGHIGVERPWSAVMSAEGKLTANLPSGASP